jgi:hypothetical protein
MSLADKINQARVVTVKVDHMTFTGRRPTIEEYSIDFREGARATDLARKYIDGWSGVCERDLFASGSNDPVEFDYELWAAAVPDLPHLWKPIRDELEKATLTYFEVHEAARKNFLAGSK